MNENWTVFVTRDQIGAELTRQITGGTVMLSGSNRVIDLKEGTG